jgi:hypothetical protein
MGWGRAAIHLHSDMSSLSLMRILKIKTPSFSNFKKMYLHILDLIPIIDAFERTRILEEVSALWTKDRDYGGSNKRVRRKGKELKTDVW